MPTLDTLAHALVAFLFQGAAGVTWLEFVLVGSLIGAVSTLVWAASDQGL